MFYIIESEDQLDWLKNQAHQGGYVDIISTNDSYHPFLSSTVAVYIKPTQSDQGYIIPINHDEGLNVDKERIYHILKLFTPLYTVNKKDLLYHLNLQEAIDLSLLYSMSKYDRLQISDSSSTVNWYYSRHGENKNLNTLIPLTKLYERSENIYQSVRKAIELPIPSGFEFYNKLATNVFFLLETRGLGVHYDAYVKMFTPKNPLLNTLDNTVFTSYNLYNATSRPTNSYNSVNYAAIPKTEEHRKSFHPQNDYFVEFDFDGYHLRLLCDQIGYNLTQDSAHKQLAKHYFGTEDITEEQYIQAKQINFQAIYGKIPEEHRNLEIFKLVQEYIDNMWSVFKEVGEVCNPQSGKPFTQGLKDMNPAKLMNYMMQSLETSNNILILKEVLKYLKDKKTFITLYTYDAILFDFSKEDGKEVLETIKELMESGGKYPVKFKYSNSLVL